MPITVRETPSSRRRLQSEKPSENRAELEYTAFGNDSDDAIIAAVYARSPPFYKGMPRRSVEIATESGDCWTVAVQYANQETQPPGTSMIEFDTGGGTQHITQSYETIATYFDSALIDDAPDFFGAIGVTEDAVEGCDIVVPVFNWTERHFVNSSLVTNDYVDNLYFCTGRTNEATFRRKAAGEVIFMGASGAKRGYEDWEIAYKFAASPNVSGRTIGTLTGIDKGGWEYLWILYTQHTDDNAKFLVKKPTAVYIERVYEKADFGLLGIGVR